ncbi:hypothetical protein PTSG_07387 [Salpingoeca rosetta]|uniref:Uncharacterized protein n=1 Tax=Salpingoeca rosetta (strain ATCC 50818 / BSB-021) TaxID=946362 RepID=F2UIJ7_SALR5|nr:uncharacterized protein PTSG_07387 [Salpingoeca rosetta]EGD77046.1 hypothetical protein PTSG_07387 [Salpingoeca rosetta]|eukprot:XP_004990886.1 hypothetical protein PTSG_07387 [Salpingoeca rosetta]
MADAPPPYSPTQNNAAIPTATPYTAPGPQQGYPPQAAYPPQQQAPYQGYQYQPQQQQQPPVVAHQPTGQLQGRDRETAERREREQRQTDTALGLACGGFLCCLCVGVDRAAAMGRNVADFLLCMHVDCWGF